jgi:SAM-dependent methyltransferase
VSFTAWPVATKQNESVIPLPLPPLEFRRLVGPTAPEAFDNSDRRPIVPDLPDHIYDFVFDFGCGCGRLARRLAQQEPRPARYRGVDPHKGMIDWCRANLEPSLPGFEFRHHDVFQQFMNPDGQLDSLPLPAGDSEVTLFLAWSVFTHVFERDAAYYLGEIARVLAPGGVAITTWFLFDKRDFPMMQSFQNALFISDFDPTNAVIFDRGWLRDETARAGLAMTRITPPVVRGFQWTIQLEKAATGRQSVEFPADTAPEGVVRAYAGEPSPSAHA